MIYTIADSSFGPIFAAQSEKGLCALFLGGDLSDLQKRFPRAKWTRSEELLPVIQWVEKPWLPLNVALDEQGTDFQRRVWGALREIPVGSTVSYSDIAHNIGSPKAARAVAGACAANPLAVVTPCHRVIRSDGSLSGYGWGVEQKKRLLELEARSKPIF